MRTKKPVSEIRKERPIKTCSCGHKFYSLPKDAKLMEGLYWFNCACKSTCAVEADLAAGREHTVRIDESLHEVIKQYACMEGMTTSQFINEVMAKFVSHKV